MQLEAVSTLRSTIPTLFLLQSFTFPNVSTVALERRDRIVYLATVYHSQGRFYANERVLSTPLIAKTHYLQASSPVDSNELCLAGKSSAVLETTMGSFASYGECCYAERTASGTGQ